MAMQDILIVDDSATSRMIIKRCLDMAGVKNVNYHEAEDGLKGLEFLQDNTVDIVLSDLKMPKMDGTVFIRKLKLHEKTRNLPVIVISSMGNDVTEGQLREQGVKEIITKPVSPEKITSAIINTLGPDAMGGSDDDDDDLLGDLI